MNKQAQVYVDKAQKLITNVDEAHALMEKSTSKLVFRDFIDGKSHKSPNKLTPVS